MGSEAASKGTRRERARKGSSGSFGRLDLDDPTGSLLLAHTVNPSQSRTSTLSDD